MVKLVLLLGLAVVIAATAGVVTTWELQSSDTCRQNDALYHTVWGGVCSLWPPLIGTSVSFLAFALLTTTFILYREASRSRDNERGKPT